jgi:hypothetical protein
MGEQAEGEEGKKSIEKVHMIMNQHEKKTPKAVNTAKHANENHAQTRV